MINSIPNGVWATVITPYDSDNDIDFKGLGSLIEWYAENGVDGLFAVCQSSEMFKLSLKERISLAKFVKKEIGARIPVIASGHISSSLDDQITELKALAETGVDAIVLVTGLLAQKEESEDVWKRNTERILSELPDVNLGLYECPLPYKRLLSESLLQWCASTGRFTFVKETSCDLHTIEKKLNVVEGSDIKIFNANSATLLKSLKMGAAGFCGVMTNFHPDLYVWLLRNWEDNIAEAEDLQDFLGVTSVIERQCYPTNAKYHLGLKGIPLSLATRVGKQDCFGFSERSEVEQLGRLSQCYSDRYSGR